RILRRALPDPRGVAVAVQAVDAPVTDADARTLEGQVLHAHRDLGVRLLDRILVVGMPPHEHAESLDAVEGGEGVDLPRPSFPGLIETTERPGMARGGPHPARPQRG